MRVGLGVCVAGLAVAASLAGACRTEIQHGLEEREANRIVALLKASGIDAEKVKEKGRKPRFTIRVPKSDAAKAFTVLLANDLPQPKAKGVADLFGKPGLVPTSTEEHVRMVYALSGELAETLKRVDGILDARVHLVVPQRPVLAASQASPAKPRASVLLIVRAGSHPIAKPEVQALVAGAVPELEPGAVQVVFRERPVMQLGGKEGGAGGGIYRIVAAASSAAVLLLGVGLVFAAVRIRNLKRRLGKAGTTGTGTLGSGGTGLGTGMSSGLGTGTLGSASRRTRT